MGNFYNWQRFFPLSVPGIAPGIELYGYPKYKADNRVKSCRLSLRAKQSNLLTLLLPAIYQIAKDSQMGNNFTFYKIVKADMSFELNDEKGHFTVVRNGVREVEIELEKSKGFFATVTTFFANKTAKSYIDR